VRAPRTSLRLPQSLPFRPVAVAFAGLLVVVALESRAFNVARRADVPFNPSLTSERIVIGVVGASAGPGRARDAEVLRGLRLWMAKLRPTRGIPYGFVRKAAVRLTIADGGGDAAAAARAARRLLDRGATYLVGPTQEPQLDAVSEVALRRNAMLLSPVPRPVGVRQSVLSTFLARPSAPWGMPSALDAVALIGAHRPRAGGGGPSQARVAIVLGKGRWATRGRLAVRRARQRGYRADELTVDPADGPATLARVRAGRYDVVLAVGSPRDTLRWFRLAGSAGVDVPWVLAVDRLARGLALGRRDVVALETTRAPTFPYGGLLFTPNEFADLYRKAYGAAPGLDAAAGAALGVTLSASVERARSTDPSRVLKARDSMRMPSFYGTLAFKRGEQLPIPSVLVLGHRGTPRFAFSRQGGVGAILASVPARSAAGRAVSSRRR
jgi:ABC-type branched-subunit amino acid transport system substrate-binding protein